MAKIAKKKGSDAEIHLFIIWENARDLEQRIVADLKKHFTILTQYEITWSDTFFSTNLTRFYGQQLPPGSFKEEHCGTGPFQVVIVQDTHPQHDLRFTSKGYAWVNSRLFDAKTRYRQWTGGGHKIHATNTPQETEHDLTLLLGKNTHDFLQLLRKQKRKKQRIF